MLRAAEGGFDERRFGFAGLMDLLRALQREGIVRLERDRRGGLRVFQGTALSRRDMPAGDVVAIDTGVTAEITYEPENDGAAAESGTKKLSFDSNLVSPFTSTVMV